MHACTVQALAPEKKTGPNLLWCYCSGLSVTREENSTGGGRECFGETATWAIKQRWMGDEYDENPAVNSTPRGLKYSAGHNRDEDLGSVALVGVVGSLNATSLGQLFLPKQPLTMIFRPSSFSPSGPGDIMIKVGSGPSF